jgi:hypothetical protein
MVNESLVIGDQIRLVNPKLHQVEPMVYFIDVQFVEQIVVIVRL